MKEAIILFWISVHKMISSQLVSTPATANNYRCSMGTVLVTDTGLISDAEEQMRYTPYFQNGFTPYQEYIFETQLYLPNQHCTWLLQPHWPYSRSDGQRKFKFTFSKFELEKDRDFIRFYAATSAQPDKLVRTLTGSFALSSHKSSGCCKDVLGRR